MANIIQSVERALKVLLLISKSDSITVQNLSKALGVPRTTLYPLVNTLEKYGFVSKNEYTSSIHIGWKLYELGFSYKNHLNSVSREIARNLRHKWDQSVYVSVYEKDNIIVYIVVETPNNPFSPSSPLGFFTKAHSTASGKILLSHMPKDKLSWINTHGALTHETPKTITEPQKLLEELDIIRDRGYSVDDEECKLGLACIAAPIKNSLGEVIAAISISGSKDHIMSNFKAMKDDVIFAANQISNNIGL